MSCYLQWNTRGGWTGIHDTAARQRMRELLCLGAIKDAVKNRVDVFKLPLEREGACKLLRTEMPSYRLVAFNSGAKVAAGFPCVHGVCLDEPICLLAQHSGRCEIEEQLAGEDEPARGLKVLAHALRVYAHSINQPGGFCKQVVGEDGRVRQDNPLDR